MSQPAPRFAVGDRVRIIDEPDDDYRESLNELELPGAEGVVQSLDFVTGRYAWAYELLAEGTEVCVAESDLEPAS